ncbi:MAG: GldG family protein [Myxococcota bacterium]
MTHQTMQDKSPPRSVPGGAASNAGRIAGAVGVVLLVSTPLTWLLTAEFGALVWGKLVIGALLVGFYLSTNAQFFAKLAGSRSTGLLALSSATVVIVLGLVGIVNYLAIQHPKQWDLTREGIYTLSDQTRGVLERLDQDVRVLAFYNNVDPEYAALEDVLGRYAHLSKHLTYEMVDPQSRPDLVEQYKITEQGPRIVIVAGAQESRAKDFGEEDLTNAIIKVAQGAQKTIYFLVGHGEQDIADGEHAEGYKSAAEAIGAEGYKVAPLSLLDSAAGKMGDAVDLNAKDAGTAALTVPADAAVVVVAGPRSALLGPETKALEDFVAHGGRLLALLEPNEDSGLESLLGQWKIGVQEDLIVDVNPLSRLLGLGPAAPMVQPTEVEHAITKGLNAPGVLFTARSLAKVTVGRPKAEATALLEAGSSAWGETSLVGGSASRDDKDHLGPLTVAMAATENDIEADHDGDAKAKAGRVVAFGDSDWANNQYLRMQGNSDVLLNAVNWLAEEEQRITIRPKSRVASQLFLSGEDLGRLKFFSMDILPVLLIAMGLGIVLIRRQR